MIQHVTRQVQPQALAPCVEFYAMVGFAPVAMPPSLTDRGVWLGRAGGPQLHLLLAEDARPEQGHVAFVVDDYAGTVEELARAGFALEPRRQHWGSPRGYVRDPAGNLVELMAWAPGEQPQ